LKSNSLEQAIEWLSEHANDPVVEETKQESAQSMETATEESTEKKEEESDLKPGEAHSLKCDECGKLLKDADAASAHAYRTQHSKFSESTESIKPRTAEEIEAQKRQLEEKLIRLRKEREEREKNEAIEREKSRRKQGHQITDLRQKVQETEMKKLAEERRRDKLEAERKKQLVKERIAQDREDFKRANDPHADAAPTPTPKIQAAPVPVEKRSYDECKIQVRLTDGKTMVQTFKAKEQLAAVRLWIEINRTDAKGAFGLLQTFPRKQYNEDDMMRTLEDLGLVPASSLIVTRI